MKIVEADPDIMKQRWEARGTRIYIADQNNRSAPIADTDTLVGGSGSPWPGMGEEARASEQRAKLMAPRCFARRSRN